MGVKQSALHYVLVRQCWVTSHLDGPISHSFSVLLDNFIRVFFQMQTWLKLKKKFNSITNYFTTYNLIDSLYMLNVFVLTCLTT